MSEKTSDMIYIATVNNSDVDRLDIVYAGKDHSRAADALWKAYNELNENKNVKYKKDAFIKAAEQSDNSAYIQFSDSHINFELHERPMDDAKQS